MSYSCDSRQRRQPVFFDSVMAALGLNPSSPSTANWWLVSPEPAQHHPSCHHPLPSSGAAVRPVQRAAEPPAQRAEQLIAAAPAPADSRRPRTLSVDVLQSYGREVSYRAGSLGLIGILAWYAAELG